jgi:hypothetical protein
MTNYKKSHSDASKNQNTLTPATTRTWGTFLKYALQASLDGVSQHGVYYPSALDRSPSFSDFSLETD